MPFAYVLYVRDEIVGPHLALIRRICQPQSDSEPHITVRYPVDRLQASNLRAYEDLRIGEISAVQASAFGLRESGANGKCVVFIECFSDELEALSYKPDFPDTVFHITLYVGEDQRFARQLLRVLQDFKWDFTFRLPSDTKLSKIPIGSVKRDSGAGSQSAHASTEALLRDILGKSVASDYLIELSDEERLELVRMVCHHLQTWTANLPRLKQHVRLLRERYAEEPIHFASQGLNTTGSLWPEIQALDAGSERQSSAELRYRRKLGMFLTPPELAHDIVHYALSLVQRDGEIEFGDPATGNGVFFSALIRQISETRLRSAIGIEIDPGRVRATERKWSHRGLQVIAGDYLHLADLPRRNLIIANPPYVRYQDIPPEHRATLARKVKTAIGIPISGQAGLYVYFLLLSHEWMKDDAVAAWLIPSEFLETVYGKAVRQYLAKHVELIRIHQFQSQELQFENALVSSTVVVFRNRRPSSNVSVLFSKGGSIGLPVESMHVATTDLAPTKKWTMSALRTPAVETEFVFGDIFEVKRGIATGANKFFVITRSRATDLRLPREAIKPVLPKAARILSSKIESDKDGYPLVDPQLVLIDCCEEFSVIKRKHPTLAAYLASADPTVRAATLVKRRKIWYCQEQRTPAPFLCTYMGRRREAGAALRFFWNDSEAIALNTYLMVYPRPRVMKAVAAKRVRMADLFQILTAIDDEHLLPLGRLYGGGLHKIEPRELVQVPIGDIPTWLRTALSDL